MRQETSDRRVERRALTAAIIDITDQKTEIALRAVLEDLSPSGACVYIERKLEIGSQVSLSVGDITRTATITHRERCDGGFRLGVQFKDGKWPEPIGIPMHWIEPSADARS